METTVSNRSNFGGLLLLGAATWMAIVLHAAGSRKNRADAAGAPDSRPAEQEGVRLAKTPGAIRATGWWDILRRTYGETIEDRIPTVAAGITFYSLLALFPAVSALVSLYGLFTDPATVRDHLSALSFMLPAGTFQIVEDQVSRIIAQGTGSLTAKLALGLAIAVWGANAGMKAVIDGLNIAYEEPEKRSFLALNAVSLALTLGALIMVLLAIFVVAIAPAIMVALGLSPVMMAVAGGLRWLAMALFLTVGLSVLYRLAPSRTAPRWRWVTPGGVMAALLWIVVSIGLSTYLSNFADYNATYGSLGAAVALMMWIWLSACAILIGAELNAEIEHQTAIDVTAGRGAHQSGARIAG